MLVLKEKIVQAAKKQTTVEIYYNRDEKLLSLQSINWYNCKSTKKSKKKKKRKVVSLQKILSIGWLDRDHLTYYECNSQKSKCDGRKKK